MLHCFDKVWVPAVGPASRDLLFLVRYASVMSLICSRVSSKPPRSAISPWLMRASWRKAKRRVSVVCMFVCDRDKAIPVRTSLRGGVARTSLGTLPDPSRRSISLLSTQCELPFLVKQAATAKVLFNSPADPESAWEGAWSDWSACQSQCEVSGKGRPTSTDAAEPTAATGAEMKRIRPALRNKTNHGGLH